MPESMGQTLTSRLGPLPVWAWAGLGTAGLGGFLYVKKKKADAANAAQQDSTGDSSNLGSVPISDLTTVAQPMPIQMGDTFVNVNQTDTDQPPTPKPVTKPTPPPGPKKPPAGRLKPPGKPPGPPSKTQKVTVCAYPGWCGSLWGIAQHFYGSGSEWPKIYTANKGIIGSNPNLIHVGQVLTIPAKS